MASVTSEQRRAAGLSARLLVVLAVWVVLVVMLLARGPKWFGATSDDTLQRQLLGSGAAERRNALLELAGRMKRRDPQAVQLYPALLKMTASPDAFARSGAAWAMGMDTSRNDFHQSLVRLLNDTSPEVQANASVSLSRFNDPAGRQHLAEMLNRRDSNAAWEALRALKSVGTKDDLAAIAPYETGVSGMPDRVQDMAREAARAIRDRE